VTEPIVIRPQPAQERFLTSPADIAIYGGAAGGGKSYALLMEPIRHYHRPEFYGVIFRRQATQIKNEGGLWDESEQFYPHLSAVGSRHQLLWGFPSGARLRFAHLEYEQDKYGWMGAQVAFIGFDELTHFTEGQFWYLLSRNRSTCGVKPYLRATCNPDPDSFVADLVKWWIDQQTGFAIPERAGVLRWFVRQGDELLWADSSAELVAQFGEGTYPKSLTFVPASIHDNAVLLQKDPGYLANLMALPRIDRERLLKGNWLVRPTAGLFFKRSWLEIVPEAPANSNIIRYWDRAATEATAGKDPDWTVGVRMSRAKNGIFYVEDVVRLRGTPAKVEEAICNTAAMDGKRVRIGIEKDPGQAGVAEASYYIRALAGYNVRAFPATKNKETRSRPVSAQCEAGNVKLVRAPWNEAFLRELENFPDGNHDDQVDATSGAFDALVSYRPILVA
jgi:predicted phage terminase large subunit-like protein